MVTVWQKNSSWANFKRRAHHLFVTATVTESARRRKKSLKQPKKYGFLLLDCGVDTRANWCREVLRKHFRDSTIRYRGGGKTCCLNKVLINNLGRASNRWRFNLKTNRKSNRTDQHI
jgi:hypothetical protein